MKNRKPDLLFVLAVILGCGIIMTSYGSGVLNALESKQQSKLSSSFYSQINSAYELND